MGAQTTFLSQTTVKLLQGLIRAYQWLLSPFMGHSCRFVPTCSCYAQDALRSQGLKALPLIIRRIMRCNPFHGAEILYDPAPVTPTLEKTL